MNNQQRSLVKEIKKTWNLALVDSKNAMDKAILTGESLSKLKEITPNGEWESLFYSNVKDTQKRIDNALLTLELSGKNRKIEFSFGIRQAQKLMQIAANKTLFSVLDTNEILTIDKAVEAIKSATPEQFEQADQLRLQTEQDAANMAENQRMAEIDKKSRRELEEKKKREGWGIKPIEVVSEKPINPINPIPEIKNINQEPIKKEPEIRDENFRVIAELRDECNRLNDLLHESNSENKSLIEHNNSLVAIFESNVQLSEMCKELNEKTNHLKILNARINGLMHETSEAKRYAKMWKQKYEKLEKYLVN